MKRRIEVLEMIAANSFNMAELQTEYISQLEELDDRITMQQDDMSFEADEAAHISLSIAQRTLYDEINECERIIEGYKTKKRIAKEIIETLKNK